MCHRPVTHSNGYRYITGRNFGTCPCPVVPCTRDPSWVAIPVSITNVRRSTANDPVSPKIWNNGKLWPFFQGCLGAIDGSHIHLSPPNTLQSLYWNQKGFLSQNCLFICNFDMLFTYILTSWEGSATDAWVWPDALAKGF
jgi:hypothetical protein